MKLPRTWLALAWLFGLAGCGGPSATESSPPAASGTAGAAGTAASPGGTGPVQGGASGGSKPADGMPIAGTTSLAGNAGALTSGGAGGDSSSAGSSALGGGGSGDAGGSVGAALPAGTPQTVLLDGARLKQMQTELRAGAAGTPEQKAAFDNLIAAAELALGSGTWSVTRKPSEYVVGGDPHEYVSWGPYWWPADANPPNVKGTFGKCPYKSFDGQHNPDVAKVTDRHGLHATTQAILQLALAWYLTGNEAYADQAELVARVWFLNADTRMNPSMAQAQSHGPCGAGTATGIIEAAGGYLTDGLDGLAILALDTRDSGWSAADQAGMRQWMLDYIDFLKNSGVGKAEAAATNNHGTWYDALLASLYLFTGDQTAARNLVNGAKAKRIDSQVKGDGSMPDELSRATSWHYVNYNAAALCRLAATAARVDVDLWGYTNPAGGSIAKAIAFVLPTATSASPPGAWAQYDDITKPFDAAYQAEAYYSIRALAEYGKNAQAQQVLDQTPRPIQVPGHYCAGDRFPLGSDFCGITPGNAPFQDLQMAGTAAIDMWPILPTCRVPIN